MSAGEMAGRVEAAEGPSRQLDAEIEVAVRLHEAYAAGLSDSQRAHWAAHQDGIVSDEWTSYASAPITASLDAAVRFVDRVLPNCNWCLTKDREADVEWGRPREERWFHSPADNGDKPRIFAKTPAMALVAAALRAIGAEIEPTREGAE